VNWTPGGLRFERQVAEGLLVLRRIVAEDIPQRLPAAG